MLLKHRPSIKHTRLNPLKKQSNQPHQHHTVMLHLWYFGIDQYLPFFGSQYPPFDEVSHSTWIEYSKMVAVEGSIS